MSLGIAIIFGLLDIANISQPAFVILGSYAAYVLNAAYGFDPILTGLFLTPVFYVVLRRLAGNKPLKLHGQVPHVEAFASAGGGSVKPVPASPQQD